MRVLAGCALLAMLSIAGRADSQSTRGVIVGMVRDSLGGGLSAAQVTVSGTPLRATSDDEGRFRIERVGAGDQVLIARRLGFVPDTTAVRVSGDAPTAVEFVLVPITAPLTPVVVTARAAVYDARLAGFNTRRENGVGHFVTRERLDAVHSYRFIDIMREIPGVRVGTLRGGSTVRMRGASCDPLVFIDGFPAAAGAVDLDMIDLNLVEGIEVYSGLATIPPEFVSVRGQERCGVVAIWTRPHRARQRTSRSQSIDLERLVAEQRVHTADEVQIAASLEGGTGVPIYPDSLWRTRTPGRVVVELVVEPDGSFEESTLRVVSSTHPGFTTAVRIALVEAKFRPGQVDGRPVRQLIHLPFVFSADSATAESGGAPPPLPSEANPRAP